MFDGFFEKDVNHGSGESGRASNFAAAFNKSFNPAAAVSWILGLGLCFLLNRFTGLEIFFLGLPGWFIASLLYVVISYIVQKNNRVEKGAAA